ncbi:MAG TPA: LCP family protein, partial [Erysipelothrix sp.]|nr:LCP family protein [Erysipelothrix sp.]
QILMTSIPRDTYVIRHTNGKYGKLSLVGLSGMRETVKTIEDFMGMDIDYTLRVNWTSVVKVVDALGGIEVNSPHSFRQGQYYFNKGLNKLDGNRALAFVRNRKSLPDDEDSRAQNQQIVLTAIVNKLMSPAIIMNYSDFLSSISSSIQTSMPQNQLNQLIRYQLDHMPSWDIYTTQIIGDMFDTWEAHSAMGRWQIVKEPHKDKLDNAIEAINKMKQNETITQEMFD